MTTTEANYEQDLAAAESLIAKFVDFDQADGMGEKWVNDALNNAWKEGLTIAEWVARAVSSIPTGFRRSAQ